MAVNLFIMAVEINLHEFFEFLNLENTDNVLDKFPTQCAVKCLLALIRLLS